MASGLGWAPASGRVRVVWVAGVMGLLLAGCGWGGEPRTSPAAGSGAGELAERAGPAMRALPPLGSRDWSFGGGPAQRVLNLRTELGLDASQIDRIESLVEATEPEAAPASAHATGVDRGAYTRAVHPGVADAYRHRYERLTEEVRAVLTPEQRHRFDEIRESQLRPVTQAAAPR